MNSEFNQAANKSPTLEQKIIHLENKVRPLEASLSEEGRPGYNRILEQRNQEFAKLQTKQTEEHQDRHKAEYQAVKSKLEQAGRRALVPNGQPINQQAIEQQANERAVHYVAQKELREKQLLQICSLENQEDYLKRDHALQNKQQSLQKADQQKQKPTIEAIEASQKARNDFNRAAGNEFGR